MSGFFTWIVKVFRALGSTAPDLPALPAPAKLEGVVATVFIRESNGSRTVLENFVEAELIARKARVVIANQSAGIEITKTGGFTPLAPEAHFSFVGTLVIKTCVSETEAESEHDFDVRKADWKSTHDFWSTFQLTRPEPLLQPRLRALKVSTIHHSLIFRVIGRDGTLLGSGCVEKFTKGERGSYDSLLKMLAEEAVSTLDSIDVWQTLTVV